MSADGQQVPEELSTTLRVAAQRWDQRPVLLCVRRSQELTFAELDELTAAVAHGLRNRDIGTGRTVALLFRNDAEFPVFWLGVARSGACAVALNIKQTAVEIAEQLTRTRAALVITDAEFVPHLNADSASRSIAKFVVDTDRTGTDDLHAAVSRFAGAEPALAPAPAPPPPETIANVQFTSGSTGLSKGCLLSHRYWLHLAAGMVDHGPRLRSDDVLLTAQPFYYVDPQWNLVAALRSGARLVVLERFRSSTFWADVRHHRATFFYCLGVMPAMLLTVPVSALDRDNVVRYVACSGIPSGRHEELEERFGAPWHEAYGSTETGVDIMVDPADHARARASGALGRPLPNREIKVVDDNGSAVPRDVVGLLLIRGTAMSDGYLDDVAGAAIRGNGWYATGDLVVWQGDGLVRFAGRVKDIIRRAAENVSARQVEDAVATHPAVEVCACVPVEDPIREEEIKVYVVLLAGTPPTPVTELIDHTRRVLAPHRVPRYWELRDDLPRTPSEKVAKASLRSEKPAELSPCFDAVAQQWLEHVSPKRP